MKFIDPLATLIYMGGAPPIHFTMAIYAIFVYSKTLSEFCPQYEEI